MWRLVEDDLRGPEIAALLQIHLDAARAHTPAEHVFALDLSALRVPEITFWTAWEGPTLVGCGALRELSPVHGELKSMHTAAAMRGRGVGTAILQHIVSVARSRNYERLSLETGTMEYFGAARRLYATHGFVECGAFGDYPSSTSNQFMTRALKAR